jgi:hypothetical protein
MRRIRSITFADAGEMVSRPYLNEAMNTCQRVPGVTLWTPYEMDRQLRRSSWGPEGAAVS